ncbi:MAG: MATE family efflux transporter [Huintestinicola sp.]
MNNTRYMTEGSETGHIVRFALPLLGGNLLQQTYNLIDTAVVGRYLGDDALAAVGATGSITYLFYTLCIGLSIGAGVIISQLFGSGDDKKLRLAVVNSAIVTAVFGIAVSVISVLAAEPVLRFLNVPQKLIGNSAVYMKIACGGTVAVAAYNWINAVMRAVGDSKTPLIFLGAASILNAVLDLLFVVVLGFGVSGAAWATVLAQGLSAVSCIIYCFGFGREISLSAEDIKADRNMMLRCIKTGLPIAAQNGLISVSMTALQRVTNGFGENVMAAYTVSMRIEQLVQQPFSSLNVAVSTFTGQNIGAGKNDRAVRGLRSALKISTVFAFAVLILFVLFGRQLTAVFVTGSEVIGIASRAIVLTGCFYWALGIIHTVRGFLNGSGDTGYALINGSAEVICRIGLSLLLTAVPLIGYWGIWLTTCFTWFVTAAVSLIRYKSGRWKDKSVIE